MYNLRIHIIELHLEWCASVKKAILDNNVEIGMTKEQVQASRGFPNGVSVSIDKSGIHEQWHYGVSYYLYFANGELFCWYEQS